MYNLRKPWKVTQGDAENAVNESYSYSYSQATEAALSPGMDDHDGQVAPHRQQATAQRKCATWNVRTFFSS